MGFLISSDSLDLNQSRMDIIALLEQSPSVYHVVPPSAISVNLEALLAYLDGNEAALVKFTALVQIEKWHLALICHAFAVGEANSFLASTMMNCLRQASTRETIILSKLPADSPVWDQILTNAGLELLDDPEELWRLVGDGYEAIAQRLLILLHPGEAAISALKKLCDLVGDNPDRSLQDQVAVCFADLVANPRADEMIMPLLHSWPLCEQLLEKTVLVMSPVMFDTIVDTHRNRVNTGAWRNTLRDALKSRDGMATPVEIMRRLLYLIPPSSPVDVPVTKKRKREEAPVVITPAEASSDVESDDEKYKPLYRVRQRGGERVDPPKIETDELKPEYLRVKNNIFDASNEDISWNTWMTKCDPKIDPLNFRLMSAEWIKIGNYVKALEPSPATTIIKRRLFCFWIHNTPNTVRAYMSPSVMGMLMQMAQSIARENVDWARPLIESYRAEIMYRNRRAQRSHWLEFFEIVGLKVSV